MNNILYTIQRYHITYVCIFLLDIKLIHETTYLITPTRTHTHTNTNTHTHTNTLSSVYILGNLNW